MGVRSNAAAVADRFRTAADVDLTPVNADAAAILADALVPQLRRRTGALRASVRVSAGPDAGTLTIGVPYAGPMVYGWPARGIRPGPGTPDTVAADVLPRVEQAYADAVEGAL